MKTWFITGASRGFGALFVKEPPLRMPFSSDTIITIEAKTPSLRRN